MVRRRPGMRSRNGPSRGATTANGAIVNASELASEVTGGDARAAVAHGQLDDGSVGTAADLDRAPRLRVTDGIVEQMAQGGRQLAAVAEDGEPVGRLGPFDADLAPLGF